MPSVELPVSTPRLRAVRWTTDELHVCMKDHPVVARVESGRVEAFSAGRILRTEPGTLFVKKPGDVYRELSRNGPGTLTIVSLPEDEVAILGGEAVPDLEVGDERARPLHRLVDAVVANAERLEVEVALADALSAIAQLTESRSLLTRPVRRAMEYLRARLADSVSLDELAAHAERDKFYLCRAFRAQVGMPPHAYLTQLRILHAKRLLASGVRAAEVATRVGFYDQPKLTRHFRRIVGTTPVAYARAR